MADEQLAEAPTFGTDRPYGFDSHGLNWMIGAAVANSLVPAAAYILDKMVIAGDGSTETRQKALYNTMKMHVSVWGPIVLFGMLGIWDIAKPFTALILEHVLSNGATFTYIYAAIQLLTLALTEDGNWWIFSLYFIYSRFMDAIERQNGTFAMYYLNPLAMTIDPYFHPSIYYLLGIRKHKYRYYYYYPETTPNFDL